MDDLLTLVVAVSRLLIGAVLAYAGYVKLRDLRGAQIGVLDYRLLPASLSLPAAVLIGSLELLIGAAVALGIPIAAAVAVLLLAFMSCVAASALLRGLDIDCHCTGEGEVLSAATLIRNGVLMTLLCFGLLAGSPEAPISLSSGSVSQALAIGVGLVGVTLVEATRRAWILGESFRRRRR